MMGMNVNILTPLVTVERFSELTGIPTGTVHHWIVTNQIPTHKIGKRRLINLAKIYVVCLDENKEEIE